MPRLTRILKNKEALSGLILLAIFIIVYAVLIPYGVAEHGAVIKTTTFPKIVTALLIILSLVMVVSGLIEESVFKEEGTNDEKGAESSRSGIFLEKILENKTPILLFIAFFIYYLLFDRLGYILSSTIVILFLMYLFGGKKHVYNVLITAVFVFASYIVFKYYFGVDLPVGALFG